MQCPRCEQGSVVKSKVGGTGVLLYVCEECEASWFNYKDIGGKAFFDYGGYMESLGLLPLWSELQVISGWKYKSSVACNFLAVSASE